MSVKMTTFAYQLKGKELDMNTKKSFKTKSEELYIDYIDVFNKLEIQLQFDLREIFKHIPIYSKIDTKKSLLMFYNCNIVNIYVSQQTLNYYVTLDNGDLLLFNMLPIQTRYNLYKYLLNLNKESKLKQFVIYEL